MRMLPVLVLLHALAAVSYGKPDGAPKSACGSLTPAHSGILPQRNAPPYTVSAVKMENNKVKVTITSSIGEEFEGFALQARQSRDMNQMVEGKFTERSGVSKTIDCFRGRQNTLTQVNPSPKREIVTEWTPDNGFSGDVVFRATVAKTFAIFWVEVDSRPVKIRGSPNSSPSSRERNDPNRMYDECFVAKGCFGYPTGCVTRGDCEVLLSYVNNVNGVTFEMKGYLEPQTYMAMGLSTDARMGEDKVTECGRQGSTILVKESWNAGQTNGRTRELPSNSYNSDFTNGLTTCSWTTRYLTETEGRRFDLENSTYHVLLAKGPMSNGRIGYHSGKIASQEPVNFTAFELIRGEGVSDSIKIHGMTEESVTVLSNEAVPLSSEEPSTETDTEMFSTTDSHSSSSRSSIPIGWCFLTLMALHLKALDTFHWKQGLMLAIAFVI